MLTDLPIEFVDAVYIVGSVILTLIFFESMNIVKNSFSY